MNGNLDFIKRKGSARRSWAALLVVVRALLIVFAMQFSGVGHDISDFVETVTAADDQGEHEDCPPDRPCNDCPPGCPNCHCAPVLGAVPPLAILPELLASTVPASLYETQAPHGPDLPGLFRPPRA